MALPNMAHEGFLFCHFNGDEGLVSSGSLWNKVTPEQLMMGIFYLRCCPESYFPHALWAIKQACRAYKDHCGVKSRQRQAFLQCAHLLHKTSINPLRDKSTHLFLNRYGRILTCMYTPSLCRPCQSN